MTEGFNKIILIDKKSSSIAKKNRITNHIARLLVYSQFARILICIYNLYKALHDRIIQFAPFARMLYPMQILLPNSLIQYFWLS